MERTNTNEIQIINQNGEAVVSSLDVAERFGKRHDHVMRDIRTLVGSLPNSGDTQYFLETTYKNEQNGQTYAMYLMNRDGFSLLAMGFTGKEALEWKIKYIDAFNQMEAHIRREGQKALRDDPSKKMRAEAMLKNAQTRQFKAIMQAVRDMGLSHEAVEVVGITAIEQMTGQALPYRPPVEKLYTATQIANEIGCSAHRVGQVANANGIKIEKYGKTVLDKAAHSDKQIPTFLYNETGKRKLIELCIETVM